ncbi:hypothetical protein HN51_007860, partial [Arachis hypogaea]
MTFASGSFNSTLRRGNVTHYEYIQVGEGRDVGLNQISLFEAKVACGNGEQTLSRDIYRLGHRFDFFRMLLCLLFDDSRILCNVKYARAKGDNALKAARILLKLHNLLFTITDEQSCMVVQNTEQAGAVLWSSMRRSPRTKGCTQEKSLCERAAAFDLVFTLRFYSTRHRGTEHPSFSAPNFSVSNSIPSGQVTLSSSTESDKEKRVQKLSRENERKHSSGKAIRPGKRFKLRFLLAILILLRYHQISKKSRFKLCQKPFAERKFEDQDQDWIENQSPQHSIQVGLSIQVVRPIIQHPRPGRCLLQIQVPLILTQLGLIDSQPIPTWDSEVADSVAESVDLAVSVAVFDDVYVSKSLQESISDLAWKIRTEEDSSSRSVSGLRPTASLESIGVQSGRSGRICPGKQEIPKSRAELNSNLLKDKDCGYFSL